jgi:hypothetical protein
MVLKVKFNVQNGPQFQAIYYEQQSPKAGREKVEPGKETLQLKDIF